MKYIESGISSTGNWPYNPQIFDEIDFSPAFVADRDIIQDSGSSSADPKAFQSELSNEQVCSSSLDTGHRDNASGMVDQSANFLKKILTRLLMSYLLKVLPLPKAHKEKILIKEEVKQESIPTILFVK